MQIQVLIAFFVVLISVGLVEETVVTPDHWLGLLSAKQTLLLLVGSILIFTALVRGLSRWLLARLNRLGWQNRSAMRLPAKCDLLIQVLLLLLFATQLTIGGWCKLLYLDWNLQNSILLWEVGLLAPFLVMMIFKWACFYPINHFIRTHMVADQIVDGVAARPVWTLGQYLTFQIRNGLLIVLAPLLVILSFRDLADWVVARWFADRNISPDVQESVYAVVVITIFFFAPLFLRYIWSTRSLPPGPLRERLSSFCERLNLRYRDILLWNTYSAVSNAAVMGLLAPVRYVLLSDALIENMSDEQIEAVFGHETGHVKHHHILFLLLFVLGFGSLMILLSEILAMVLEWPAVQNYFSQIVSHSIFYGGSFLLAMGWLVLFGWVSRRFEWQADAYAALVVDRQDGEGQTEKTLDLSPTRLGLHGASIVGSALERIAVLNGMSVYSRSWRHSSIANRVGLLRHLATEAGALAKFQRLVIFIKWVIVLMIGITVTGWWWISKLG